MMLLRHFLRSKEPSPTLGLAIGSRSIQLLALDQSPQGDTVTGYASQPLPPNCIVEGQIVKPEPVAECIAQLQQQAKTTSAYAAITIPHTLAITKTLTAPAHLNDDDMEAYVRLEADHYIPYPLDQVAIDFAVLDHCPNNQEQVNVLLAACAQTIIAQYINVLQRAQLQPSLIDIDTYANQQTLQQLPSGHATTHRTAAYVVLQTTSIALTIQLNGQLCYSREQSWPNTGRYSDDALSNTLVQQITHIVAVLLDAFYVSSHAQPIEHMLLAGDLPPCTATLMVALKQQLGITLELVNPFSMISCAPDVDSTLLQRYAPTWLLAYGLAIRRV